MIIIKDVPGLSPIEVVRELVAISGQPVPTGHGGFLVDEDTAETFLSAYLIATGRRKAPEPAVVAEAPKPRRARRASTAGTTARKRGTQ